MLTQNLAVRKYTKVFSSMGKHIVEAQYAVRGAIPIRGAQIKQELAANPSAFAFDETVALNVGNPQQVGQGYLTFNREVLAGLMFDNVEHSDAISHDAKKRIAEFRANAESKSPMGGYTLNSKGFTYVRTQVADYISRRDGVEANPDNINMTNGASEGCRLALTALIRDSNDGVLCPIPQYPLYSALLTMKGGQLLPYYLNEDAGWSLDAGDIER